ncbi:MAG: HNH endonuclease [Alphaproteobacteria bacterium]|nr:HNH endonuclease [Alphaproteobacteria bacterium]
MMIDQILNMISDCSLAKTTGRFVSDKSYAYDTIYFMAKFILETADDENIFNKQLQRDRYIEYTKDIFQIRDLGSGAQNYMIETLNLLCFANLLVKQDNYNYKIAHKNILEYIAERIENAYIFLYLVVYQTFNNDDITDLYKKFISETSPAAKEAVLFDILSVFRNKSVSIGTIDTNWEKQLVKYALIVLGFANNSATVARTLRVKTHDGLIVPVSIKDISINVEGTRTGENSKKVNDYINFFAKDYVQNQLAPYMFINVPHVVVDTAINHIAEDLASLKIEKIIKETDETEYKSKYEQNQFIERKVRARNQNIQRAFKNSLLDHNAHRCPICGFEYEDFLIASHIKPYAQCDDTYDAINNFNGFLMCPNHDKLFEGAKLMTIDAKTGTIILSKQAQESKDFGYLHNTNIDKSLVECERRHYLAWHNAEFYRQNGKKC